GVEYLVLRGPAAFRLRVPRVLYEDHQRVCQTFPLVPEEPLCLRIVVSVTEIHATPCHRIAEPEGQAGLDALVLDLRYLSRLEIANRRQQSLSEIRPNPPTQP